jgi:hypothetical protein
VAEAATALDPLLLQLRASLGTAPTELSPAKSGMGDPLEIRATAEKLAKLLAEFDASAVEFTESKAAILRSWFADEAWSAFTSLVNSYAFADAHTHLQQVIAQQAGSSTS